MSALSRPKRRLAPPARTNPRTWVVALTEYELQRFAASGFFFDRLATRPANSEFAQFFLEALAMEANRRRSPRHVPSVTCELLRQIRHLEFVLRLAKIVFAEPYISADVVRSGNEHFSRGNFFRQVSGPDFFATAKHEAPLQRVFQFADVARPIVALDGGQRFPAEPRRSPQP